jgi:AraC-like DNA-binding protein
VHIAEGLHAFIADWPADPRRLEESVWAEIIGEDYGWLYVGLDGDATLEAEGLGLARRPGATCSLTVVPRDSTYVWSVGPKSTRRGISIAFHASYLRGYYPELLETCSYSLGDWLGGRESKLRDFQLPLQPVMIGSTSSLLRLALEGKFRHQYVSATVTQLLCLGLSALVGRENQTSTPVRLSMRDKAALREVREGIRRDFCRFTNIDELARRVGLNRNKFRYGFKELYGMTVSDYLHDVRMSRAWDLLSTGELSVTDVAAAVGYGHVSNFTTAFKRHFGCTPRSTFNTCECGRTEK